MNVQSSLPLQYNNNPLASSSTPCTESSVVQSSLNMSSSQLPQNSHDFMEGTSSMILSPSESNER